MNWWIGAVLAVALGSALLAVHDVPTDVTPEDMAALAAIAPGIGGATGAADARSFGQQIAAIRRIQEAVLDAAPEHEAIALGEAREPKDLIEAAHGFCYDRSRAIEKALTMAGIPNRHAYVYESEPGLDRLFALARPELSSHAVTEALTEKGWILIDSNARWIALTANGQPKSLADIAEGLEREDVKWSSDNGAEINAILREPFGYVFGLYSRHGRFFAPYSPIPDVDFGQLLYNLAD